MGGRRDNTHFRESRLNMSPEAISPRAERAQALQAVLETAIASFEAAATEMGRALDEAGSFLDEHEVIPVGAEGVEDDLHDLYTTWDNASERVRKVMGPLNI